MFASWLGPRYARDRDKRAFSRRPRTGCRQKKSAARCTDLRRIGTNSQNRADVPFRLVARYAVEEESCRDGNPWLRTRSFVC